MPLEGEEELPVGLEELEKEIEELEKAEIVPPEKVPKKPKKPEAVPEAKLRISSIIFGYFVVFVYFVATLMLAIGTMLSQMGVGAVSSSDILLLSALISLATIPLYPNVLMEIIIAGAGISPPSSPNTAFGVALFLALLAVWAYSSAVIGDAYILLLLVGMLPYILGGVVCGAKSRSPGYGFVAGLIIWVMACIIMCIMVWLLIGMLSDVLGRIAFSIGDIILGLISWGYLSAIFFSIFGALGGRMHSPSPR